MRVIDILNSEKCRSLFAEIQKFSKMSLSRYNDALEKNGVHDFDKDIFDFVWGTVNFTGAEMYILDSPLLQRLRRIKQLGLASTVYCNADSSRFSHTIGVTEIAGRMASIIHSRLGSLSDRVFDAIEVVRLAAIFHDTGHMFFSHVSEVYYSYDKSFPRYDEVTAAKTYFSTQVSNDVSLHELISVMIVNSPETQRLLRIISPILRNSRLNQDEHFEQLTEYISCLIVGIPVDKFILPYASAINSSVDADKLDYLSRDSACTKVPIAVDIARIVQKLDVVSIREIDHPPIWNDNTPDAAPLRIMAIRSSAKRVFWQLSSARSSMFESVYYHHKVLTAETMFRNALRELYEGTSLSTSFTDILSTTDEVFNEHWEKALLPPEEWALPAAMNASNIFSMIRNRDLYKRVAAFSQTGMQGSMPHVRSFFLNVIMNPLSEEFREFTDVLKAEYGQIHRLLDAESKMDTNPTFLFIYSKYDAMASVPFEGADGYCIWSSSLMKQETIETGKKSRQEQFFLLTNCRDRDTVYIALEKALTHFDIFGLQKESSICSKASVSDLNKKRIRLLEKGYYKDTLFLLQNDIIEQLFDKTLFYKVVEKYRLFSGVNHSQVTKESLLQFLRQFLWIELSMEDLKLLFDGILQILYNGIFISRDVFSEKMEVLSKKLAEEKCEKKYLIRLGGPFDSANHLSYYFNDIKGIKSIIFDGSVGDAISMADEKTCLCFFDDGAYSGKQVISIFQELMGVPLEQRTTNEHHVDELSNENKKRLRKTRIALYYLCFNSDSEAYILEELAKIGLEKVSIYYVDDLATKIFDGDSTLFPDEYQKNLVQSKLKVIGQSILESTKKTSEGNFKPRWDEKRVSDSALGYNDAQQMVVFSSNIPTYSITAFWANGYFGLNKWQGLFQRTDKD